MPLDSPSHRPASGFGVVPFLLGAAPRRLLVLVAALMVAVAVTEGVGIVMLVPMLAVLGEGAAAGGIAEWLASLGLRLELGPLLAAFVVLVVLRSVLQGAQGIAALRLDIAVIDSVRDRLYRAIVFAQWRMTGGLRGSDTVSMMINRVDMLAYGFQQLLTLATVAVTLGGIAVTALILAPRIALAGVVAGAVVLAAFSALRRRSRALGVALGKSYDAIHAQLQEGLNGLRLIKMLRREERSAAESRAVFAELREGEVAFHRAMAISKVVFQAGAALALAAIVWLAIEHWRTEMALLLPLIVLFGRAVPLLNGLLQAWHQFLHASASIGEVQELLRRLEAEVEPNPPLTQSPPSLTRAITLAGATLLHPGRDQAAVETIDLAIPAGRITAVVGASGAGKSTIADLVSGLIAPDRGAILIDDVALDAATRCTWRGAVAYVQQEPVLFNGTIRHNLRWAAPEANEARIRAALADASAQFVLALPAGLDTAVGDAGRQLSGGERQRIVLARALLRDPALLILDEATSALDPANEAEIAAAVERLRGRLTILIIAHRGALTDLADQVVRLDRGRVVSCEGRAPSAAQGAPGP